MNNRVVGNVSSAARQFQGLQEGIISYMKAECSMLHNRDQVPGQIQSEEIHIGGGEDEHGLQRPYA